MKTRIAALALVLLPATPIAGQVAVTPPPATEIGGYGIPNIETPRPGRGQGEWGFPAQLFPPELVMQHQAQLGLTAEQRTTITQAIKDLQSRVVDFQWQMQDESQKLSDLVDRPSVDEVAVLAQVDKVLDIERAVKKAHLASLIRIRNTLTPAQRETLSEVRGGLPKRRPGQARDELY